jgi:SPP1 gp7 family putative phage head morphogenesis protein
VAVLVRAPLPLPVGGFSDEPRVDVVVEEGGRWHVYSEGTPRKHLGGPYKTKGDAEKRLKQIEWFKRRAAHVDALPRPLKKARSKLPRQIPPTRLEEDYAKALLKILVRARHAWAPVIRAVPGLIADAAAARGDRMDAGEPGKLRALIAQAVAQTRRAIAQPEIEALARKFAAQTSTYQRIQLANQVRAALGADPIFRDKGLAARVEQFTHENVGLVQRIPERLHGDLEAMVNRAVAGGRRGVNQSGGDSLAEDIEDRFGVSERHARVIARDQVAKFYAGVNHARQKELGVSKFIWRTVGDESVRGDPAGKYPKAEPSHYDLDGETYSYDDPPEAGPRGEPCLPGEAILCRCFAEPVFDFDDDEEPDEDEDEPDDEDQDE